ncbi:unnamed protein product [Fusarium graminearum]|uniref:Uncharacterized protein n=1 Tax=Gibberella zeae TaxID=5518 RepID=A0A4E9DW51_GIBZA|nr:unnamed protein product [Fusarium graminearum]
MEQQELSVICPDDPKDGPGGGCGCFANSIVESVKRRWKLCTTDGLEPVPLSRKSKETEVKRPIGVTSVAGEIKLKRELARMKKIQRVEEDE